MECFYDRVSEQCDKKKPFELLGSCTRGGENYFEDACTDGCELGDSLSMAFRCDDPLVVPDTDCTYCDTECNGLTAGAGVTGCDSNETYFADACSPEGIVIDRNDFICRSDLFSDGCTASDQCNGYLTGQVLTEQCFIDPDEEVSNFAASCTDNCQVSKSGICKVCAGNTVSGQCDLRAPGTPIGCSLYGADYIGDVCNSDCLVEEDPDRVCRYGPDFGCTASLLCDGKKQYEAFSED
jgi:hypothetical protein